jgi:hypothetical protein
MRNLGVDLNKLFSKDAFISENLVVTDAAESFHPAGNKVETIPILNQILKEKSVFVESLQKQVKELREDKQLLKSLLTKQDEQLKELRKQLNNGEGNTS